MASDSTARTLFYARTEVRRGLDVYHGGETDDQSLLYVHVVNPLCRRLVRLYPAWVAPNLLSVLGFVCTAVAYVAAALFWTEEWDYPRWVPLLATALQFAYQLLDNTDGKQAVRTGNKTHLGELTDHGVDTLCTPLVALLGSVLLGLSSAATVGLALCALLAFFVAHWEETYVQKLVFGKVGGPVDAQFIAMGLMLGSAVFGPELWRTSLAGTPLGAFVAWSIASLMLVTTAVSFVSGLRAAARAGVSAGAALLALVNFVAVWLLALVFFLQLHRELEEDLALAHLFVFAVGLLLCFVILRCIVQRMLGLPAPLVYRESLPLLVAVALVAFVPGSTALQLGLLVVLTLWHALLLCVYIAEVVSSFCSVLGIEFLRIPYPNKASPDDP